MIITADTDIVLRLATATILGGLIGLNRELRHRPAGLRTHALVALGAGLMTVLVAGSAEAGATPNFDSMSRVIQGILTGIGFVGAGVILRTEDGRTVHGLTTAASIWLSACLGATCGAGAWVPAASAFVLVFVVLLLGGPLERWVILKFQPLAGHDDEHP